MAWIVIGASIAVVLGIALVVDLRDRGRGGTKLARHGGLRQARRDDLMANPQTGDQGAYFTIPPGN